MAENKDKPQKYKIPFSENLALQLAQQRYFEKNKERLLSIKRENIRKWREEKGIDYVREKNREQCRKYYQKKKLMREMLKNQQDNTNIKDMASDKIKSNE